MNEWMKNLMDLLHNLIFSNDIILKEQENHNNISTCIRFMPTIIQGTIIFMNEFDFTTTL